MNRLTRDGTAEPVSRDQISGMHGDRGMFIFPVQLTTSRIIGNLTYPVDPYSCYMCDHYVCMVTHIARVWINRVYRVTQLHTDGVHCREFAGTGPVNLKAVPNECCFGRSP